MIKPTNIIRITIAMMPNNNVKYCAINISVDCVKSITFN